MVLEDGEEQADFDVAHPRQGRGGDRLHAVVRGAHRERMRRASRQPDDLLGSTDLTYHLVVVQLIRLNEDFRHTEGPCQLECDTDQLSRGGALLVDLRFSGHGGDAAQNYTFALQRVASPRSPVAVPVIPFSARSLAHAWPKTASDRESSFLIPRRAR